MSHKISCEARMTLDAADVLAILTEYICPYSTFASMHCVQVDQNSDGDFEVRLEPKPEVKTDQESA